MTTTPHRDPAIAALDASIARTEAVMRESKQAIEQAQATLARIDALYKEAGVRREDLEQYVLANASPVAKKLAACILQIDPDGFLRQLRNALAGASLRRSPPPQRRAAREKKFI